MRHVIVAGVAASAMASCALVVPLDDLGGRDAGFDAPADVIATDVGLDAPVDVGADAHLDADADAATLDYSATIIADGPLAYFHFDELTGVALKDASGNKHDATLVNGVALGAAGAFAGSGTCAHFTGSGYVSIDNSVSVNGTAFDFVGKAPMTFEAWVSIDSQPVGGYTFFSKEQPNGSPHYLGYDFFISPKLVLQREDEPVDETEADGTSGLAALDTWYYLVATYDGNAITIYVDDAVVASYLGSQTSIPVTNVPFLLGSEDTGVSSALVGKMDEVAIYSKALTPVQVAAHFHAAGK